MIQNKNRFDNQIKELKEELLTLLYNVKKEHEDTLVAIQKHEYDISKQIIEKDKKIRKDAEKLTTIAIWRIISQQPVAMDLRIIIGYMNIIRDLERISNYAKNISKFNVKYKPETELVKEISKLMIKTLEIMDLIAKAIDQEEVKLAYEAAKKDKLIDEAYKSAMKKITSNFHKIIKDQELIKQYTACVQQLKYLERLGDHLVNICETLVFIDTGKFVNLSLTIEEK